MERLVPAHFRSVLKDKVISQHGAVQTVEPQIPLTVLVSPVMDWAARFDRRQSLDQVDGGVERYDRCPLGLYRGQPGVEKRAVQVVLRPVFGGVRHVTPASG